MFQISLLTQAIKSYGTVLKKQWKFTQMTISLLLKIMAILLPPFKTLQTPLGKTLSSPNQIPIPNHSSRTKKTSEHLPIHYETCLSFNYNYPFTVTELNNSLNKCKLSAPGPDGIT